MSCISLYLHMLITYTLLLHIQSSRPKKTTTKKTKDNVPDVETKTIIAFSFDLSFQWFQSLSFCNLFIVPAELCIGGSLISEFGQSKHWEPWEPGRQICPQSWVAVRSGSQAARCCRWQDCEAAYAVECGGAVASGSTDTSLLCLTPLSAS